MGTPAKPKDRCLWQKVEREENEFLGSVMCKFIGQESGACFFIQSMFTLVLSSLV